MKIVINTLLLIVLGLNNGFYAQSDICNFQKDFGKYFNDKEDINFFLNSHNQAFKESGLNVYYRDEITIPLVFHVFNNTSSKVKITISDIYEQVDLLNNAFSAQNSDLPNVPEYFKSSIGISPIRFCIAYREENGEKEKGINFYNTNIDYFADLYIDGDNKRKQIKHSGYGGADAWDSEKYINIWIGEMASANGTATFPGINQIYKNEEGIILNSRIFSKYSKNTKVIIHEMGHYFDLYHIWGNNGGCDDDDGIEDTPIQNSYYVNCPEGDQYSCESKDMYMNYMDYTDDYCSLFFTKGQINRMLYSLYTYRKTLIDSKYLCDNKNDTINVDKVLVFAVNNKISILKENSIDFNLDYIIYDVEGRKLRYGTLGKNQFIQNLDCGIFPSGIYFVFLKSDKEYTTKKLLLINNKIY